MTSESPVYANPILYTDHSGKDIDCDHPHTSDNSALCARKRFNEILKENKPDAFKSLYHVFVDHVLLQKLGPETGTTSKGHTEMDNAALSM
jgi:hypothetical protein